jgi:uncharacterized protein GlcG (DUF336 family)
MHVTQEQAEKALAAAVKEAKEIGVPMNVTIVDSGNQLKAFVRMDNAFLGSIDISRKKAKTSCMFGMPSGNLGAISQPGHPVYGIEFSNDGLITFAGGFPLVNEDDVLIGAVGVSGGSVEQDNRVAVAAAGAICVTQLPAKVKRT